MDLGDFRGNKALVVLSGGQDSATCLVWAKSQYKEVHAVTFDYGQRHIRELNAARDVAKLVGVASHEVLAVGSILKGTSPLTDHSKELEQYTDFASMDATIGNRVELTFVPMRNALFLSLAANRAHCLGAEALVTGVCQADNANYPDCRESFILSQERTIQLALGNWRFAIDAPLMHKSKAESIKMMHEKLQSLPILAFTHTAYDGQYPPLGSDHATVLRAHGFEEAGMPDPLIIRAVTEGLMDLPETKNYSDESINMELALEIDRLDDKLRELGE